jgi:hypothetical protein
MEDKRTLEEIHASLSGNIKAMYAKDGQHLTDKEAVQAASNLIRFYEKMVEIKVKQTS